MKRNQRNSGGLVSKFLTLDIKSAFDRGGVTQKVDEKAAVEIDNDPIDFCDINDEDLDMLLEDMKELDEEEISMDSD